MKKKFKLLLFLVFLLIPVLVKADMGAPMYRPYTMVVISPNGIDYYGYNQQTQEHSNRKHLNKGDTFDVIYDYDGTYTIYVGENSEVTYELRSLDGAVLLKDELDPKEAMQSEKIYYPSINKKTTNNEAIVYAEEGVDITKGPAPIYDTVGHINKGTKIKYTYYLYDGSGMPYIYTEYNGKKGWIEILNEKVLLETNNTFITANEIQMPCGTIPKNTILSPNYISDAWSRTVLIEYNGCKKLISHMHTDDIRIIYKYNDNSITESATSEAEINVYEYSNKRGEILFTIPANETFTVLTYAHRYEYSEELEEYYVSYNNKTGWIKVGLNVVNYTNQKPSDEYTTTTAKLTRLRTTRINTLPSRPQKDPVKYMTTYVIFGATITITACIVIILVNNKKRKKKDENREL